MIENSTPIADRNDNFTRSAGKQLAVYALYAVVTLAAVVYLLAIAAGHTGSNGADMGINVANNSITIALREEPPQLDTGRSTDGASIIVLSHAFEGLIAYDEEAQLTPGVAERWEIRTDGATFWLREDARWSDGQPVTAHDFEFAWKRAIDPALPPNIPSSFIPSKMPKRSIPDACRKRRSACGRSMIDYWKWNSNKRHRISTSWLRS